MRYKVTLIVEEPDDWQAEDGWSLEDQLNLGWRNLEDCYLNIRREFLVITEMEYARDD